ncbi:MAG: LLM class flavin-dependent oxidoreductase [Chloroflexi bacterium]|nr:LLM class flavin-dependent oxidoreductase [Chloroflexota bacterium]
MPLGLVLHPDYMPPAIGVQMAKLAEDRGFESVWVPETWGRDAVTYLTQIALATKSIQLATGISPIFNRAPGLLAQTAASLDQLSGGRFILGLGTSGAKVVESWQGQRYDRPVQRTREYVAILRLALAGKRVEFDGEIFQLHDFTMRIRSQRQPLPIYIAAIGPRNIELTGEVADGWLPIFLSRRHLDAFRAPLDAGAARAGRSPAEISVAAFVPTLVSGDVERDRTLLRRHVALYVGGMGSYYNRLVAETYGYASEAAAILHEYQAGRRDTAAAAIPDALLDDLAISGPPDPARASIAEYQAAGVMPLLALPSRSTPEEMRATIEALS